MDIYIAWHPISRILRGVWVEQPDITLVTAEYVVYVASRSNNLTTHQHPICASHGSPKRRVLVNQPDIIPPGFLVILV